MREGCEAEECKRGQKAAKGGGARVFFSTLKVWCVTGIEEWEGPRRRGARSSVLALTLGAIAASLALRRPAVSRPARSAVAQDPLRGALLARAVEDTAGHAPPRGAAPSAPFLLDARLLQSQSSARPPFTHTFMHVDTLTPFTHVLRTRSAAYKPTRLNSFNSSGASSLATNQTSDSMMYEPLLTRVHLTYNTSAVEPPSLFTQADRETS